MRFLCTLSADTIAMVRYEKVYRAVHLRVDTNGIARPTSIEGEDGRIYKIDKVKSKRMSLPQHVGAILTLRYDVLINGMDKVIFLETSTNKWFVEKPIYD